MNIYLLGIILLILFSGCRESRSPDVRDLLVEVKIHRLDSDVFALEPEHPNVEKLARKYGRYFDLYANGVLQLGHTGDPEFGRLFSLFLRDTVMREVYDSVAVKYVDMSVQEKDLSHAWAYYAYYFPDRVIPQVYAHVSGFNQSVVVDSAAVAVSLDNYLGENCQFYSMLATPIPLYARKKMTEREIARDILWGWCSAEFPYRPKKNDLLSGIIYQGKLIYLLEKIFPDYEQQRLFGYSAEQLKWCRENESRIWGFLIENEYLFSTQQVLVMKYLSDAPFTSGMPSESPGRAVFWSGYNIVKAYVEKSGAGMDALMQEQDYHKMMKVSGYRP